jgi:hypothetical protein
MPRYFISIYTDGPSTRWNVIDRRTQEWVCRFATEQAALDHAGKLNAGFFDSICPGVGRDDQ